MGLDGVLKQQLEEKLRQLSKKLELVMKTTRDPKQRKRVSIELARLQKDFMRLQDNNFTDQDVEKYLGYLPQPNSGVEGEEDESASAETFEGFPLLREVPIVEAAPYCDDLETNELFSFIAFMEHEYLAVLSETHLMLDYAYSQKRDDYFSDFSVLQMHFRNYLNVLEDLSGGVAYREYEAKLRTMRSKEYMNLLMKSGDFIKKLRLFVLGLIQDYRDGGNIIMEPESVLHFDELHGERMFEGFNVVVALEKFVQFLTELVYYLNIPELK